MTPVTVRPSTPGRRRPLDLVRGSTLKRPSAAWRRTRLARAVTDARAIESCVARQDHGRRDEILISSKPPGSAQWPAGRPPAMFFIAHQQGVREPLWGLHPLRASP